MIRYYCSGFDSKKAFCYGLGKMLIKEIKKFDNIVYIPADLFNVDFDVLELRQDLHNAGIIFKNETVILPDMDKIDAKNIIKKADFIIFMGGDSFIQKDICEKLKIIETLKKYEGVVLGYSAGAMFMSKYIIITPCSEEYPEFKIENGLNLDNISIYPHNNTNEEIYPDILDIGWEKYAKKDLIKVAKEYGNFYLLQDYLNSDGKTDVSIIKSVNGKLEFYYENNGKIWIAKSDGINIIKNI